MYGYIYKTTNLIDGKIYVGKHTISYFDEQYKGSGSLLWKAIHKYGWDNFKVELIEECQDEETLNEREKYWIATLHSLTCDGNYNIQDGGDGGWGSGKNHNWYGKHLSDEHKHNLSKANKGKKHKKFSEEVKRHLSEAHKGKVFTDEHRKHLSEKAKLRHIKMSNEHKEHIRQGLKAYWNKRRQENGKN